ncbi:MAG: T9SS type A sorting domain-containing protein [Bacteroidota bacterium]
MKKILLTVTTILAVGFVNGQNDTLSAHCTVATLSTGLLDATAPIDSGFVAGNNVYGDVAKMRLFDPAHEVTSGGTITGLAFYTLTKTDMGGSIQVAIWSDVAGEPNPLPIGFKTVTLANIDTAAASVASLGDGNIYNNIVMFTTPITIPASGKFWAGIVLPDNSAGNLFALPISITNDGSNLTNTGEFWNDGSFNTFGDPNNWNLDASIAVYPIVNFNGITNSLEENNLSVSIFPNPTNSVLNVKTSSEATNISIISMDGKVVASGALNGLTGSINVSELVNGVYFYEVSTANGSVIRNTFVKN